MPNIDIDNPILPFGKFWGRRVSEVSDYYVLWLARQPDPPKSTLPLDVLNAARARCKLIHTRRDKFNEAQHLMSGVNRGADITRYVIEYEGDVVSNNEPLSIPYDSLDDALHALSEDFPLTKEGRKTPDPEDDRILVWEILSSGHRKVVWQFCGWHYNSEQFACGQGSLPGDTDSLYGVAIRDC